MPRPVPKFAVVGSGPAGLGVLTALLDAGMEGQITLFEIDRPLEQPEFSGAPNSEGVAAYYSAIYRELWRGQKRKFPPPKTHFAATLPKFEMGGKGKIFRSDTLGGLSNFWGGTALPFTDVELAGWPVRRADLDPHYARMAAVAGIAGRPDGLNRYFGVDYVNRPPMHLTRAFEKMEQAVESAPAQGGFTTVAGVNRCMLETRPDAPDTCVRCGECLAGCFRGSIFSTRRAIQRMIAEGRVELVRGKVRAFDSQTRTLTVAVGGSMETFGGFERIYLAAGCPNTTEIVLRSLGLREPVIMADNAVYVFPVLHLGRTGRPAGREPHLSLSNLLLGLVPGEIDLPFAQAQIYANFDYMWRYNFPPALWPLARGLVAWSRDRIFWARLYVHGRLSQSYAVSLEKDALHFSYARGADQHAVARMMPTLRHALNRRGFYVPPLPPLHQNANSHYATTLPAGGAGSPVNARGEVAPGVFVCDSAAFPDLPAVSLTFTIMAQAHRLATQSL
ncbi:MAG: GMC family oxidoreductase [Chthoniobacter sp.]|nr:GMC family oxidoreductase [Chthoniobacter sp.]